MRGVLCPDCFGALPIAAHEERCPYCFLPVSFGLCPCQQGKWFCQRPIERMGALFEERNKVFPLLIHMFQFGDERVTKFLASLLVIQAENLDLPWCDLIVFSRDCFGSKQARRTVEMMMRRAFHVKKKTKVHSPTIYYIVPWIRPQLAYKKIALEFEEVTPKRIIVLGLQCYRKSKAI